MEKWLTLNYMNKKWSGENIPNDENDGAFPPLLEAEQRPRHVMKEPNRDKYSLNE